MGAAESVPQTNASKDINVGDNNDGSELFCPVPSSESSRKSVIMPQKSRLSSTCTATILTYESTPCTHLSGEESDGEHDAMGHQSHHSIDEEDCWAGPVLRAILSLVTPRKMNAITSNNPSTCTLVTSDNYIVIQKVACNSELDVSDKSEKSWGSPVAVEDFPPPASTPLPLPRRLDFDLVAQHSSQDTNRVTTCNQATPLPTADILPSKRPQNHHVNQSLTETELLYQNNTGRDFEKTSLESRETIESEISSLEYYLSASIYSANNNFVCLHPKATALHKLGILHWKCGKYFFSESALTDCIHVYQHLINEFNADVHEPEVYSLLVLELAHVFITIGRVHLSTGEEDAAMQCYRESVRYLSCIPSSKCTNSLSNITPATIFAQACVGAGRVLASQGSLKASLKRYKRALKVQLGYREADSPVDKEDISSLSFHEAKVPLNDVAETLTHLGRLYELRNDLARAMECHLKSLAVLDPNAVDVGYVMNNIGHIYLRLGKFQQAEDAFARSHEVFSQRLGKSHRNTADALLSIGQLYASQGHHRKALSTFKRVLRLDQVVFGQLLAKCLHLIAVSYEETFRLNKALKYYEREVNVLNDTSPNSLDKASLLQHMAKIAMQAVDNNGEYRMLDEAANWLEEAADIYHQHGHVDSELPHLETFIDGARYRMKQRINNIEQ